MPSSLPVGGMRMSVSTTSGSLLSMPASSAGRSAHEATRSISSRPSSNRAMPSRNSALVLGEHHPDRHIAQRSVAVIGWVPRARCPMPEGAGRLIGAG